MNLYICMIDNDFTSFGKILTVMIECNRVLRGKQKLVLLATD